jgi:hypothetical protein
MRLDLSSSWFSAAILIESLIILGRTLGSPERGRQCLGMLRLAEI